MKYRLKDKALQAKLDRLTDGEFSENLNIDGFGDGKHTLIFCGESVDGLSVKTDIGGFPSQARRMTFTFCTDEIEEVPTYDPTRWNAWPDVEPPKGVLMRVEVKYRDRDLDTPEPTFGKVRERTCARFTGEYWIRSDGSSILFQMDEIVRFRPWDDTTSTLSKKMLQEIVTALESHPEAYELGYLIDAVDEAANELTD